MRDEFGNFVDTKRRGKGVDGYDLMLKDIAQAMGISRPYLSDIIRSNRKPPEFSFIEKMADIMKLDESEREELYDIAGRSRNTVAPDILDYIMDVNLPNFRKFIRVAKAKELGDEFWKSLLETIQP